MGVIESFLEVLKSGSIYVLLFIAILSLLLLIVASSRKLFIYFDTFMYLSKKQNYEKANFMANSSFIKYFYSNIFFYGYFNIELIFTILLSVLSFIAIIGYLSKGSFNYGYLNYYYGDIVEYTFVNSFIQLIIMLSIIYLCTYIYWYLYYMIEDDKLKTNEKKLKKYIIDNLSYDYLYSYHIATKSNPDTYYTINNYVEEYATKKTNDPNHIDPNFETNTEIFKLCFTNYILTDTKRFIYIKKAIIDSIAEPPDRATLSTNLSKKLENIYIIANYNQNDNRALLPLDVMMDNLIINITASNPASIALVKKLDDIHADIKAGDKKVEDIQTLYKEVSKAFMDTITIYKNVYDKYSTYYMASLLITNFLLTYALLIFIYIIIKIFNRYGLENLYNVYKFRTDLLNYGIFILIAYYFVSCPIIIFGFN